MRTFLHIDAAKVLLCTKFALTHRGRVVNGQNEESATLKKRKNSTYSLDPVLLPPALHYAL